MELKDFIHRTLEEIIDGVHAVQTSRPTRMGDIERVRTEQFETVEFDIALTSSEGEQAKGGIGVFFGAVGVGGQSSSDAKQVSQTRVKFCVALVMPPGGARTMGA